MNKTRIEVDVKSEYLTKEKKDLIERMMVDIGFVLIKYFEERKF
jgi:hypothetical protein